MTVHMKDGVNPNGLVCENEELIVTYTFCTSTENDTGGSGDGIDNTNGTDIDNGTTSGPGGTTEGNNNTDDDDGVTTSPVVTSDWDAVIRCINSPSATGDEDATTISVEAVENAGLAREEWAALNDYLQENSCSEEAQENVISHLIEEFAFPHPHCSSFEYANGLNGLVKSAAVIGIKELFVVYYIDGFDLKVKYVNVALPIMYFNMPSYLANGQAATLSALALEEAIDATDDYLDANPLTSQPVLEEIFKQNINLAMNTIQGSSSTVPSFPILNPAPYVTNFFTNGVCN